jgi:hypothetical protein
MPFSSLRSEQRFRRASVAVRLGHHCNSGGELTSDRPDQTFVCPQAKWCFTVPVSALIERRIRRPVFILSHMSSVCHSVGKLRCPA